VSSILGYLRTTEVWSLHYAKIHQKARGIDPAFAPDQSDVEPPEETLSAIRGEHWHTHVPRETLMNSASH
jgi:hypothetical protein